ncbi:hypothetical protein DAVIS_02654 [Mycobacterium marinum]|uniref:Helix-turn-helix domain-containing protein n=1 Tax=Mycobacterium marinum TaxID=1781 RepID=A0A3E2MW62_MYCMR|nr:hypothetical protein DAVIS_02654 [Mycobacterium marinum]
MTEGELNQLTRQQTPRRRWTVKPWPWPGDSREDKAKRVALSYRQLAFDIAQGRCDDPAGDLHRLDQRWSSYGVYWPVPNSIPVDLEEWLSAAELAHYVDRTPADIYRWARRGAIEQRTSADGAPEYLLRSALEYQRCQRERRRSN